MNDEYRIQITRLRKRSPEEVAALKEAEKQERGYGASEMLRYRDNIGNEYSLQEYEAVRVLTATLDDLEYDAAKKAIINAS